MNGDDEATALARSIFELRRMRADHLPEGVLSEIAWNILLALFVADADGRRMTGHDVLAVAEAPVSTGRRWIMALHSERLVIGDGQGHLEDVIGLTPEGISAVEACMIDAQKFLQTRLSRSAAA
ncbi:hypothetical protein [Sphingomonas faeni]|uniref:hypothetical protein n=1 Tax=Sphingomonas faeni TaxID=185950 RepID=UPI003362BC20